MSNFIGNPETWQVVARASLDELQSKLNMIDCDAFRCKITVKIPLAAFTCQYEFPFLEPSPTWMFRLFENLDSTSTFSNVKLVSRDGKIFYCHKSIFEFQSEFLATMFRQPHSKREKKDIFDFPMLGDEALAALLQYLYTGLTTMNELHTVSVIEVIDAAEQYGLPLLKQAGKASLWQRIAQNVEEALFVIRLSDLHDDMKELKMRAMDILLENYESISSKEKFDLCVEFGGGNGGRRLAEEFASYGRRRLTPFAVVTG